MQREDTDMTESDGYRPRTADEKLLRMLVDGRHDDKPWGRITPGMAADELDFSPEYATNRLSMLHAAGYVKKPVKGVYEITDAGIEILEEDE